MKQSFVFAGAAALVGFALFACDSAKEEKPVPTTAVTAATLAEHNSAEDCWMAISGKVFDVSSYVPLHPGNSNVLEPYCGTDATEKYKEVNHSMAAATALNGVPLMGTHNGTAPAAKTYTRDEVATHKTADDCWMTIGTRIYNVSGYFGTDQTTNNTPFVHRGGSYTIDNESSRAKNKALRTAIVGSLCGKDVAYYFGDSTATENKVATYSYSISSGATCSTPSTSYGETLTGTCEGTPKTCTTTTCTYNQGQPSSKPHTSNAYRLFFEKFYIAEVSQ